MLKFRVGVIAVVLAACQASPVDQTKMQAASGDYCNAEMPEVEIWNGQVQAAGADEYWVTWPYTSQTSALPNQTVAGLVDVTQGKIVAASVMENSKVPQFWGLAAPRIGGPGGNPPPPPCDINPLCAQSIVAYGIVLHNAANEVDAMVAGCKN